MEEARRLVFDIVSSRVRLSSNPLRAQCDLGAEHTGNRASESAVPAADEGRRQAARPQPESYAKNFTSSELICSA